MNKTFTLSFLFLLFSLSELTFISAQCQGNDSYIYGFNDPGGAGTFNDYLCNNIDSVGTYGPYGYYNGDGYRIRLISGSQVTFSVDSCDNDAVSITVTDSMNNIIPGAYSSAACPNSLDFTPPYTGLFKVIINLNGVCNVFGSNLLGQAYAVIKHGTSAPACPGSGVMNDTICGATELFLDSNFEEGNSTTAFSSDPMDSYVVSLGYSCSPPNNTMWYYFTPTFNMDSVNVWITSSAGSGFHSWIAVFTEPDTGNPCSQPLSYIGCVEGADDPGGVDTISFPLFGIIAGNVYYFMIDGYNGSTGEFSIALKTSGFTTSISNFENITELKVFPNPASEFIRITSMHSTEASFTLFNSLGSEVLKKDRLHPGIDEIDISSIERGVYIGQVRSNTGSKRIKLFIN